MARKKGENVLELMALLPWWVSVAVAVVTFVGLRFIVPAIEFEKPIFKAMAPLAPNLAWLAVIFLIPAVTSAFDSMRKRKMLDRQSGLDSIRSLSWKQFEELLGEAYRRQGFRVVENPHAGPDGGIDLELHKGSVRHLVQAKQWKTTKVGVKVVREMFGIMKAEGADAVSVVTSGMFTQEAKNFAENKPIDLVDGDQLLQLIQSVQATPKAPSTNKHEVDAPTPPAAKLCPRCGKELVLRVARKGEQAGNRFWGCGGYPNCRHTEPF